MRIGEDSEGMGGTAGKDIVEQTKEQERRGGGRRRRGRKKVKERRGAEAQRYNVLILESS